MLPVALWLLVVWRALCTQASRVYHWRRMSILVKWGTERFQFALPAPTTKLGDLRTMLADHTGLDAHSFKLVHAGAIMKDDSAPISSYGIHNGSKVAIIGSSAAPPGPAPAPVVPTEQNTVERVRAELEKVRTTLVPPVDSFLATATEKQPARGDVALEHKRLDELLLQSLLRLDAITPDPSWEEARRERKVAVKEVQSLLDRLDAGWKALPH